MMDNENLRAWVGRSEQRGDEVTAAPLAALSATLDRDDPAPLPGSNVPPLWHWLLFLPMARASEIGPDGHPRRGGFLPPVELPRRMWAGGRLSFHHALQVGDEVTRTSTIQNVETKSGRSGSLVFVTVRHEIANARGVAISEEHDIVYRDASVPGAPVPPARALAGQRPQEAWGCTIVPNDVLLFRYSALTFNSHRIHYDRKYATEVEGYPGLVVHGPLIATLLLDLLRRQRPEAVVKTFTFKALRPTFDLHAFNLCGRPDGPGRFELWAHDHDGELTMQATAETP